MKAIQFISGVVFLTASAIASNAAAAVYKCTTFDKKARQSKVVYTDAPCSTSAKQTLTDIQSNDTSYLQAGFSDPDIDLLISRAVLKRDFKTARSLATTKEHWRLIAVAEGKKQTPQVITVKTSPPVYARNTRQDSCTSARYDYESTARNQWRDKDLIATKKSMMFAACGTPETVQQNRPVVIGHRYRNGINSSRWYGTPYGQVTRYNQRHYNNHGYSNKRGHSNHVKSGGGVSLRYKSKHFGVRASSFGTQSHTSSKHGFRRY